MSPGMSGCFTYYLPMTGGNGLGQWLASISLASLGYRWSRTIGPVGAAGQTRREQYRLDRTTFVFILIAALLITGLLQVYVYHLYGGLSGYVKRYEDSFAHYGTTDPGIGFVAWVGFSRYRKAFPYSPRLVLRHYFSGGGGREPAGARARVLLLLHDAVAFWGSPRQPVEDPMGRILARGSDSLVYAALSRRMIYMGLIGLLAFMYFYAFYRFVGLEGVQALAIRWFVPSSIKNWPNVSSHVLGDLGRSDVQAFALNRVVHSRDYDYAWGRTYLGALAIVIPRRSGRQASHQG